MMIGKLAIGDDEYLTIDEFHDWFNDALLLPLSVEDFKGTHGRCARILRVCGCTGLVLAMIHTKMTFTLMVLTDQMWLLTRSTI